jgi:outer membrane lipoprotein-sorting protein
MASTFISAQSDNEITKETILNNLKTQFNQIKDYTVTIHAEMDMENINIPPMDVTVYFKQPDKIHLKSDGFAMLPKQGLFNNPNNFNEDNFYISLIGLDTLNTYKLELIPRKDEIMVRKFILWVNSENWTISKIKSTSLQNQTSDLFFQYVLIDNKFWMPKIVTADIHLSGFDGFVRTVKFPEKDGKQENMPAPKKGRLTVQFSKYKINSGLSDDIFE